MHRSVRLQPMFDATCNRFEVVLKGLVRLGGEPSLLSCNFYNRRLSAMMVFDSCPAFMM